MERAKLLEALQFEAQFQEIKRECNANRLLDVSLKEMQIPVKYKPAIQHLLNDQEAALCSRMMFFFKKTIEKVVLSFAINNPDVNGYAHDVVQMLRHNVVNNPEGNLTHQLVAQSNLNPPMDTSSRDQLHTPTNSVCAPSANEIMQLTNSSVTEQSVDQQVMGGNGDQVINHENGSGDEDDDEMCNSANDNHDRASTDRKLNKRKQSQPNRTGKRSKKSVEVNDDGDDDELSNSTNDNHDGAVVASNEPSTSARARSNRVTSKQSTASTARKLNKRKQSQPNRTGKRSKKTVEVNDGGEDEEDGDEIVNENREEAKFKVLNLNCTVENCNVKLDSMIHLHGHLSTVHQLAPLRCFATNCNARFDEPNQLRDHIKLSHSQNTRFLCAVCPKQYDSQIKANKHWYLNHLTGQLQCNLADDCVHVTDSRNKMITHQLAKHYSQSKNFHCTHPGCTASFSLNGNLKQHELTHLDSYQFHCNWHQCNHRTNRRSNLITHIRTQHFGFPKSMKGQKEKNIVELRDPNKYVRVVVDE